PRLPYTTLFRSRRLRAPPVAGLAGFGPTDPQPPPARPDGFRQDGRRRACVALQPRPARHPQLTLAACAHAPDAHAGRADRSRSPSLAGESRLGVRGRDPRAHGGGRSRPLPPHPGEPADPHRYSGHAAFARPEPGLRLTARALAPRPRPPPPPHPVGPRRGAAHGCRARDLDPACSLPRTTSSAAGRQPPLLLLVDERDLAAGLARLDRLARPRGLPGGGHDHD